MYLHELGDGAGSFTKDDMQAGLVIFSFLFIFLACSLLVLIFRNRAQTQQLCLTCLLELTNYCQQTLFKTYSQ